MILYLVLLLWIAILKQSLHSSLSRNDHIMNCDTMKRDIIERDIMKRDIIGGDTIKKKGISDGDLLVDGERNRELITVMGYLLVESNITFSNEWET